MKIRLFDFIIAAAFVVAFGLAALDHLQMYKQREEAITAEQSPAPKKPRSSAQLLQRLDSVDIPLAPTDTFVNGKRRAKLNNLETTVRLSNWECVRIEPNGAVVVDMLCCRWERDHGDTGRHVLVERNPFDPDSTRWRDYPHVRARFLRECRERNGAKPAPTPKAWEEEP